MFDGCGAIVVVGAFTGEVDFDGDVRTSVANDSPVLIALDALGGTRRWVRVLGVPGFVSACPASHVDASPCYVLGRTTDAVYLAGSFRGALGFDGSDETGERPRHLHGEDHGALSRGAPARVGPISER